MKRNKKLEKLSLKDKVEILIMEFIEYDNKHHCFKHFVAGFCTCTLIVQILILIVMIRKF